jgi:hypothetical protein
MKKSVAQMFARNALTAAIASTVVGTGMLPMIAEANQQSSAIAGRVYDQQGNPAADAEITIIDLRSGTRRVVRSNDSGAYSVRNLAVGGPYEIQVNGVKQTTVQSISLGDAYDLPLYLMSSSAIEEVIVLGKETTFSVAPGPSANFGIADLEQAVAFDRDIKDAFAIDPRLNVEGDAVNCTG